MHGGHLGHVTWIIYIHIVPPFPLPIDASYKIITRYRRIGYNLNVMRQSACLVFNPIMVDNYAAFFNCTPVGQASDSMMALT